MNFLKEKKHVILLAGTLLAIILGSVLAFLLHSQKVLEKSSAMTKINNTQVSVNFRILPQDKATQSQFASDLGVGNDWSRGFSLNLNQDTINLLKSSLPQNLFLDFCSKDLKFSSLKIPLLSSALVGQEYDFATGSAVLHLKAINTSDYSLTITDPKDLMDYATSSGELYVSAQLALLFPILDKIDTIRVNSLQGTMQGEILLK